MNLVVRRGNSLSPTGDRSNKHFVFDLDETIGSFQALRTMFLADESPTTTVEDKLTSLLRIFPEFVRPGMISLLQFLYAKKREGKFRHLYLFTNNQCGRLWTEGLVKAIERIADTPAIFDHVICAFKINNVVVEAQRTTHSKSFSDFVRCTLVPASAHICFIDDTYFPQMNKDRVFYLQPRPYVHPLSTAEMVRRRHLTTPPNVAEENEDEEEEEDLTTRLAYYIGEFFQLGVRKPSTRKVRGRFWYHLTQKSRRQKSVSLLYG